MAERARARAVAAGRAARVQRGGQTCGAAAVRAARRGGLVSAWPSRRCARRRGTTLGGACHPRDLPERDERTYAGAPNAQTNAQLVAWPLQESRVICFVIWVRAQGHVIHA